MLQTTTMIMTKILTSVIQIFDFFYDSFHVIFHFRSLTLKSCADQSAVRQNDVDKNYEKHIFAIREYQDHIAANDTRQIFITKWIYVNVNVKSWELSCIQVRYRKNTTNWKIDSVRHYQRKSEIIRNVKRHKIPMHTVSLYLLCRLKHAELTSRLLRNDALVIWRENHVKDESGFRASFKE